MFKYLFVILFAIFFFCMCYSVVHAAQGTAKDITPQVNSVLQGIPFFKPPVSTTVSTSTATIDCSTSSHQQVTIAASTTLTVSIPNEWTNTCSVDAVENATGGFTITFAPPPGQTLVWNTGSAPTFTSTAGTHNVVNFTLNGSTLVGNFGGSGSGGGSAFPLVSSVSAANNQIHLIGPATAPGDVMGNAQEYGQLTTRVGASMGGAPTALVSHGGVAVKGFTSGSSGLTGETSQLYTLPTQNGGIVTGDTLLMYVSVDSSSAGITNPSGWGVPVLSLINSAGMTDNIYCQNVTGSVSAPTVAWTASAAWKGGIVDIAGTSCANFDAGTSIKVNGTTTTLPTFSLAHENELAFVLESTAGNSVPNVTSPFSLQTSSPGGVTVGTAMGALPIITNSVQGVQWAYSYYFFTGQIPALTVANNGSSQAFTVAVFGMAPTATTTNPVVVQGGDAHLQDVTASLSNMLNIKAPPYNAQGNGFSDDTLAFYNAINDACALSAYDNLYYGTSMGGTVYVPAGLYGVNAPVPLVCTAGNTGNLSLVGDPGINKTIISGHGFPIIMAYPSNYVSNMGALNNTALVGSGNDFVFNNTGSNQYGISLKEALDYNADLNRSLSAPACAQSQNGETAWTWRQYFKLNNGTTNGTSYAITGSMSGNIFGVDVPGMFELKVIAGGAATLELRVNGVLYTLTGGTFNKNTVYFIAASFTGSNIYLYGGVPGATSQSPIASQAASGSLTQAVREDWWLGGTVTDWGGSSMSSGTVTPFWGEMDSVQMSHTAYYTGTSITLPNAKFSSDGNTELLLNTWLTVSPYNNTPIPAVWADYPTTSNSTNEMWLPIRSANDQQNGGVNIENITVENGSIGFWSEMLPGSNYINDRAEFNIRFGFDWGNNDYFNHEYNLDSSPQGCGEAAYMWEWGNWSADNLQAGGSIYDYALNSNAGGTFHNLTAQGGSGSISEFVVQSFSSVFESVSLDGYSDDNENGGNINGLEVQQGDENYLRITNSGIFNNGTGAGILLHGGTGPWNIDFDNSELAGGLLDDAPESPGVINVRNPQILVSSTSRIPPFDSNIPQWVNYLAGPLTQSHLLSSRGAIHDRTNSNANEGYDIMGGVCAAPYTIAKDRFRPGMFLLGVVNDANCDTPPSGWTAIGTHSSSGGSGTLCTSVAYHVITTSDPTVYASSPNYGVWTGGSNSCYENGFTIPFDGIDPVTPINGVAWNATSQVGVVSGGTGTYTGPTYSFSNPSVIAFSMQTGGGDGGDTRFWTTTNNSGGTGYTGAASLSNNANLGPFAYQVYDAYTSPTTAAVYGYKNVSASTETLYTIGLTIGLNPDSQDATANSVAQDATDFRSLNLELSKQASAPSVAIGAANCRIFTIAGTNSGSCKLQAQCGTSTTPVTILDNIGGGC